MKLVKYIALALTTPKAVFTLIPKLAFFGLGMADSTMNFLRWCGLSIFGGAITLLLTIWYREAKHKEAARHQNKEGNETSSVSYVCGNTYTIVISDPKD